MNLPRSTESSTEFLFLNSKAHLLLKKASDAVSGGAELQVALLSRELAARGYSVCIAYGSTAPCPAALHQGVECLAAGPFHTGKSADIPKAAPVVFNVIRNKKPQFVLVLGWTAWLFLLWLWRPLLKFKLVFICGLDTEADGSFARETGVRGRLFDFAMRRCDIIFAMSDKQQRMMEARGIRCSMYRNLILPRSAPSQFEKNIDLLWVARCQPIKRPLEFVRLAAALPDKRCIMICPPEDKKLFRKVQIDAKSVPNLQLIEFVPYHHVQEYYDRARIFVNTSISEGFANSFIQAGLGKTAILSLSVDCDGVLERFHAGEVANDNFDELVRFAAEWLEGPSEILCRYALGAARFVAENHQTERNVNLFLAGVGHSIHAKAL